MYVDRNIWEWLCWVGYGPDVLSVDDPGDEAVLLRPDFTERLFRGTEFKEILERLSIYYEIPFSKQQVLGNITSGETVSQRKHNWELILRFMAQIGFRVDNAIASELSNPNEAVIRGFLGDLREFLPEKYPENEQEEPQRSYPDSPDIHKKAKMSEVTFHEQFMDSNPGPSTSAHLGREQPQARGSHR